MLLAINDRIKGWLGIAIVVLIGLPFAFFGIESYLGDNAPAYAAKVNGIEISSDYFDRTVSRQRQALLNEYDGKLPIEEKELREKALEQLINTRLMEDSTYVSGYRISDTALSQGITQAFNIDGVFNRNRFESVVGSLYMSISEYEQAFRNELRLQQVQSAIVQSNFITNRNVNLLGLLSEQTRDISVLTFNIDHFSTASKPTQEAIKVYYENNRQHFMEKETIKLDYVEITSHDLAKNISVDEADIMQMYDDYVDSVSRREERSAQHIMLNLSENSDEIKDKLESIKKEIENGSDFSELAKKYSQDTLSADDGGDLGWVAIGDMDEAFEKTLFSMNLNSISEVVSTQFGYHLIKLNEIRNKDPEPLAEKRKIFEKDLKADAVASNFYDLTERLSSIAYENPDSLDLVTDELGLDVKTTNFFSQNTGKGIADFEKIRVAAFSSLVLEQGSNSDVIEIDQDHVVVVRVNEHKPSTVILLEKVSSKIENILTLQSGREQTRKIALEVKMKLEAGGNIDNHRQEGINILSVKNLGQKDYSKVSFPSILQSAFNMPVNKDATPTYEIVNLMSGDIALLILNSVNTNNDITDDKLEIVKNEVLREYASRDISNLLSSISSKADIEKNTRILER